MASHEAPRRGAATSVAYAKHQFGPVQALQTSSRPSKLQGSSLAAERFVPSIDDSSEYYRFRESRDRQLAEASSNGDFRKERLASANRYRILAEQAEAAGR